MFCITVVKSIDDCQMQGNALSKRRLEERAGVPGGTADAVFPACLGTLPWAIDLTSWESVFYFMGGKGRMDTSSYSNKQHEHLHKNVSLASAAAWGRAS